MAGKRFPEFAYELSEPCTRDLLAKMLRCRHYQLEVTALKRDRALHKVYMFDRWADPMLFKTGQYWEGEEPDWARMYDAATARHLETKREKSRYGRW